MQILGVHLYIYIYLLYSYITLTWVSARPRPARLALCGASRSTPCWSSQVVAVVEPIHITKFVSIGVYIYSICYIVL